MRKEEKAHVLRYSKTGASPPRYVILVFFRRPDGDHATGTKRGNTTAQVDKFRGVLRVIFLVFRRRRPRRKFRSWSNTGRNDGSVVVIIIVIVIGGTVS